MQNDVNVQMNWFERHLNWTAVLSLCGSAVFYFLLMNLSTGWYSILPLISRYRILILDITMTTLSYGYFFINAFLFTWILLKKKRSMWHLLFLLPALIFTYMGIFPWWRAENPNTQILIQWFGYAIIFIGWIEVILLRNRNHNIGITLPGHKWFKFDSNSFTKISVGFLASLMVIVACSTFIYIKTSTYTYTYDPGQYRDEVPAFSFECPRSIDMSPEYWDCFFDCPNLMVNGIRYYGLGWEDKYTSISIRIYDYDSTNGTHRSLEDEILSHDFLLYLINGPPLKLGEKTIGSPLLETTVVGKPGLYVTMTRDKNPDYDKNSETITMYFFEFSGFLWAIELDEGGNITATPPPAYFSHLLETFKIYDE
jgi:hypothetical protein